MSIVHESMVTPVPSKGVNAIIDVPMLRSAIESGGSTADGAFDRVLSLDLSFKCLSEIVNLRWFSSLETLKLDNNEILEFSGLDELKNLKWLDLSFNKIRSVSFSRGVLPKLETLSLFANQIESLDGFRIEPGDPCLSALQVLSLGHNRIGDTNELLNLRAVEALRALNVDGNPVDRDGSISLDWVEATFPKLAYFNHSKLKYPMA